MPKVMLTNAVILFLLAGCAFFPPHRPGIKSDQLLPASFDQTWSVIEEVVAASKLPVMVADREKGVLITRYVETSKVYGREMSIRRISQVRSPLPERSRVQITLECIPRNDKTTLVRVLPRIEGFVESSAYRSDWREYPSNGTLERWWLQKVAYRLAELQEDELETKEKHK